MFNLDCKKYESALESAEALGEKLRDEMGNLETSSFNLSNNWFGLQAQETVGGMQNSLVGGGHAKAIEYTYGMTEIMNEYQLLINQLRARREQIGKNLSQDNYAEPDLSSYQENELILDYEYIGSVDADCEGGLEYGRKAVSILEGMIEDTEECASDYLSLSEVKGLFEEGKNKIERIENYKEAFDNFARKMQEFEYDMSFDLCLKMSQIGEACSAIASIGTVVNDNKERIEDVERYDKEKLTTILGKAAVEWTQEDIEFIAQEYTEAINEKDVDTLNEIGAVICKSSFDVEETQSCWFYGWYYGGIPQDVRLSLLACIDPKTEGEAYFTLSRLSNTDYNIEINMGMYPYNKYETTLEFSLDENGQLIADLKCAYLFYGDEDIEGEIKFATSDLYEAVDMENMKSMGFTDEEVIAILSGAITETDVEKIIQLSSCKTEEDYEELFKTNPDELSTEATMSYYLYAYGLLEKSFLTDADGNIYSDETHNFDQFTAFLNGMLAKPDGTIGEYEHYFVDGQSYTLDYLALMAVNAEKMLDANSALIYNDYDNITQEVIDNQYKLWDMYGLILSLEEEEMRLTDGWGIYTSWDKYYSCSRIENLGLDVDVDGEQDNVTLSDAEFSYSIVTINQKGKVIESKTLGLSKKPLEMEADEELLEYNEKVEEARYAPLTETINSAIMIASIAHPELIAGVSLIKLIDDPNLDNLGTVSSKTGATIKNYKNVGNGLKTAGFVIDAVSNIQQAYEDRDKAYEEILDDWYESCIKISVVKKTDEGWETDYQQLVAKGIYDPWEIMKCRRLMNEGFAFMYDNVTEYDYVAIGEKEIQKCEDVLWDDIAEMIEDNGGRILEEKKEILLILWRGPENAGDADKIKELTADEFQSYVETLSNILSDAELTEYVDEDVEDIENIFKNISLEGEYKNY